MESPVTSERIENHEEIQKHQINFLNGIKMMPELLHSFGTLLSIACAEYPAWEGKVSAGFDKLPDEVKKYGFGFTTRIEALYEDKDNWNSSGKLSPAGEFELKRLIQDVKNYNTYTLKKYYEYRVKG